MRKANAEVIVAFRRKRDASSTGMGTRQLGYIARSSIWRMEDIKFAEVR